MSSELRTTTNNKNNGTKTVFRLEDFDVNRFGVCFRFRCFKSKSFKYLFVKEKYSQFWGFPKGRQQEGESRSECAAREVAEEVGLQLSPHILQTASRYIMSYLGTAIFVLDLVHPFSAKYYHDTLRKKRLSTEGKYHEVEETRWMTLQQIQATQTHSDFPISSCTSHFLKNLEKEELIWEDLYPTPTQSIVCFSIHPTTPSSSLLLPRPNPKPKLQALSCYLTATSR